MIEILQDFDITRAKANGTPIHISTVVHVRVGVVLAHRKRLITLEVLLASIPRFAGRVGIRT